MPLNKVLMVEDDLDIQMIARLALESLGGYTVSMCSRGSEAVEEAQRFLPDLIVLDVMMPGMDGPTTLSAMRQIPALTDTPVVFMTARVQPHEIEEYKALGALGVIRKPFNPTHLAGTLKSLWETHGA